MQGLLTSDIAQCECWPDMAAVQDENALQELPGALKWAVLASVAREKNHRSLQTIERQIPNQHRSVQPLVTNVDTNLGSDGYHLNRNRS